MLKRILTAMAIATVLASCGDTPATMELTGVDMAKGGRNRTDASEPAPDTSQSSGPSLVLRQRADAPALMSYDTSFVAVQGRRTIFDLHYENYQTWFMEVVIPRGAQLLNENGEPAAPGDLVEITVQIDPELFDVTFGPHGSTFIEQHPANLKFSLEYADLEGLDPAMLDVWYQAYEGDPWVDMGTTWRKKSYWIETDIYHFSNYAIAF